MNPLRVDLNRLVAVDVETTGLNPFRHQIVSLALVPIDCEKQSLELYIRHGQPLWQETALQYFADFESTWESQAVTPHEACVRLEDYLSGQFGEPVTAIGHNIGFDVAFLKQLANLADLDELPGLSHRVLDTHTILFLLHVCGIVPGEALTSTGAFAHFGISPPERQRHSAIGDAIATRDLFVSTISLLQESIELDHLPNSRLKGGVSLLQH
jgi:DNA polymerase III epsilon subunit-like protein